MGCVASREDPDILGSKVSKSELSDLFSQPASEMSISTSFVNAVKKKDIVLLEKALNCHDVISSLKKDLTTQQKTILHYIAEKDFKEGMALAVDYVIQFHLGHATQILNKQDSDGNTPLMVCCLHDTYETLKVLIHFRNFVNQGRKNAAGKTALDIALEKGSRCADLLSSGSPDQTRAVSTIQLDNQLSQELHVKLPSANNDDELLTMADKETILTLNSLRTGLRGRDTDKSTKKLSSLLNQLKEKQTNFVDNEFPHDLYSLFHEDLDHQLDDKFLSLNWVRAADIINKSQPQVFEGITLNNVSQSLLKGCDLYFALAAMAEYPQRLYKIFNTIQVNQQGAYSVNFLVSGIPIEILLDDYFPCFGDSQLIFSSPLKNEIWFLLLEKAFAKLYGNYSLVRKVLLCEAFEIMTGMPTSKICVKDANKQKLWKDIVKYDSKNYIICAVRNEESFDQSRVLTIAGVCEKDDLKVLKLKNHFNSSSSSSSEDSPKFPHKRKRVIGQKKVDEDCVYVEFEDFCETFNYISVCHYDDNSIRSGLEVESKPHESRFFEFAIEEKMEVVLSVHQRLPVFMNESSDYKISRVEIIVAKEHKTKGFKGIAFGDADALAGNSTIFATDQVSLKLKKGKYVARVKFYWADETPHHFAINIFAPVPIQLKEAEKASYPNFLANIYSNKGSRITKKYRFNNECEFGTGWTGTHLWVFAANEGDKTWKLDIIFDKMVNLKLCKAHRKEENVLGLIIPPKSSKAAYAKMVDNKMVKLQWKFEQSWE